MNERPQTFEVFGGPNSIASDWAFEGTNSARFALLATLGAGRLDSFSTSSDTRRTASLARFGFNPDLDRLGEGESTEEQQYAEAVALFDEVRESSDLTDLRREAWRRLNEDGFVPARLTLLAAGLTSPLERESATAATAILSSVSSEHDRYSRNGFWFDDWWFWTRVGTRLKLREGQGAPYDEDPDVEDVEPWLGEEWQALSQDSLRLLLAERHPQMILSGLRRLALMRVVIGERSGDRIVRELSMARHLSEETDRVAPRSARVSGAGKRATAPSVSTMVHGTWGWKGEWWYAEGTLHSYVRDGFRANLYGAGQEFSWSGAYSRKQRRIGADRFGRWGQAAGGAAGLQTVFAHSYGGEIVARSVNDGLPIDEVVLMSAPINGHHDAMLGKVRRVIDIRQDLDLVLTAARARQRLPDADNVTRHIVRDNYWSHSATHDPWVWEEEDIAAMVFL